MSKLTFPKIHKSIPECLRFKFPWSLAYLWGVVRIPRTTVFEMTLSPSPLTRERFISARQSGWDLRRGGGNTRKRAAKKGWEWDRGEAHFSVSREYSMWWMSERGKSICKSGATTLNEIFAGVTRSVAMPLDSTIPRIVPLRRFRYDFD